MKNEFIPVYQPDLSGNERKYVDDCLDSGWISWRGQYVDRFQAAFAEYVDVRRAVAVSNGTVALHLALLALDVGPGDEVIVPTFTYIASVNCIRYVGATPVFVDALPRTWQMDPADVERRLTPRTRAVIAVHLYGLPCDMERILPAARGAPVIEDCAEAFGSRIGGRHVGGFGRISTFSFFGNKTITTGEGGRVATHDERLAELVFRLRGQGQAANSTYWHDIVGYNYRMTNVCAAIGLAQLERADAILARKREIAEWYREAFRDTDIEFHGEPPERRNSYWMCSILLPGRNRDAVMEGLRGQGIETRPFFHPAHRMPMYSGLNQGPFPVAEDLSARGLNLPSWPGLTRAQVNRVAGAVKRLARA